jgi:NTE family protein
MIPALSATEISSEKIIIRPRRSPQESIHKGVENDSLPGIGLAVSGGGARGLALIGVLKALDREGIKINFIAGVSMGGIIGGLYACGYTPDEIADIAQRVNWNDILSQSPQRKSLLTTQKGQSEKSLFSVRFQGWKPVIPRAITSAQKLNQLLESLTSRAGIRPNISFDYLNPPLRIVCTDLLSGDRMVLSSGSLSEAMRASMAIPVAFTPVQMDSRMLVDGGLVDPIPTDVVKEARVYPVIAVDMTTGLRPASQISDIVDIADQTTTIMTMDKKHESLSLADYCITPDLIGFTNIDFYEVDSLIRVGESAAEAAIPSIKKFLETRSQMNNSGREFIITRSEVCGLVNMPKTLFISDFRQSGVITSSEIESYLERAAESGYLSDAWAEIVPENAASYIAYHLTDNPRISSVKFNGVTLIESRELYRLIETKAGSVLNTVAISNDRKRIEKRYIENGYNLVRVSADFDSLTGAMIFNIDEGRINNIGIEGAKRTRKWAIMRHIPFREGDIFIQDKGERAIDDLYGTGLFETAKLIAVPESSGVRLVVKIVEKPYNYMRGGARFDMEYKSMAFVDLVAANIFGGGQEVYLSAVLGEKRRGVSFHLQSDRLFKTLFTNSLAADYSEFKRNYYFNHRYEGHWEIISQGIELTPGRQIPQFGTIYALGLFRHIEWTQPGQAKKQKFNKLALGARSIVDTRDAISFPETGKYHFFELQFASDTRNKKTAYTRIATMIEAHYRLTKRLNFHPRLMVGVSSAVMPYFDEFSLGGLSSFPGLYEDEFLGDKTIQGSIELRNKIGDRFYVMARYNIGDIWNKFESINFSKFRHAGGVGMGIKTPIGPVQGWYGRTDKGLDAFYLDIGYDW